MWRSPGADAADAAGAGGATSAACAAKAPNHARARAIHLGDIDFMAAILGLRTAKHPSQ